MILVYVKGVIQDVNVVVCAWLRRDLVPRHRHYHAHQIRCWIVADGGLGIPELPVKGQDTSAAESTIEDPDEETGPDEDVPFTVSKDLNMVVHGPEGCDRQCDVCDKEELVMGSAYPVERKCKKKRHGNSGQLAIPEVMFLPIRQKMRKATTCMC